jgi:hypothetical protein
MPGDGRAEETGTEADSSRIIVRSFELVADLDDRLRLAPLEELSAQGPWFTRSARRMTSDVAEPPFGDGFWGRCGDSEGDSGAYEAGDA